MRDLTTNDRWWIWCLTWPVAILIHVAVQAFLP